MGYCLQMDGVDDYLKTPSLTFDEVIMDFTARQTNGRYYLDARTGIANAYFYRNTLGTDITNASSPFANGIYLNGTKIDYSTTGVIPSNQRMSLQFVFSSPGTDDVNVFSQYSNVNSMAVDVYRITFKNAGNLVADYDFTIQSSGTSVPDQSGNGNTLSIVNGGTWVSDGTGGTPTDVTITDVVASSTTDAIAPIVSVASSISNTLSATAAEATQDVLIPSVSTGINVTSVIVSASADAVNPQITESTPNTLINSVSAYAIADIYIPFIKTTVVSPATMGVYRLLGSIREFTSERNIPNRRL